MRQNEYLWSKGLNQTRLICYNDDRWIWIQDSMHAELGQGESRQACLESMFAIFKFRNDVQMTVKDQ